MNIYEYYATLRILFIFITGYTIRQINDQTVHIILQPIGI